MRSGLIAVAAVAVLGVAACGGEAPPEEPEPDGSEQVDSEATQLTDHWESAGELDNMPPEAAAALEPQIAPEDIAAAFADAGLSEGEPVDLGTEAEACDLTDCVRAFTSGEVTVMIYMSGEMAEAASGTLDASFVSGPVVLDYTPTETSEEARGDYEAALNELISA